VWLPVVPCSVAVHCAWVTAVSMNMWMLPMSHTSVLQRNQTTRHAPCMHHTLLTATDEQLQPLRSDQQHLGMPILASLVVGCKNDIIAAVLCTIHFQALCPHSTCTWGGRCTQSVLLCPGSRCALPLIQCQSHAINSNCCCCCCCQAGCCR
jgi:hypothetical protein